jgi:hypothetical protein
MTTRARKDPNRFVRKIGEREESIETKLTQVQIEDMREEVMTLLDDEERIEEKAKEAAKNFASQIKTNNLQRNELRRTIASGRRKQTLIIEEHLTASNEVVRIRKDTGEAIGSPRTATPRELQEELFQDAPAEEQPNATPPPEGEADEQTGEEFVEFAEEA